MPLHDAAFGSTRRQFLSRSAVAAAALPLVGHRARPPAGTRKKKLLMLGGTGFLGPNIVRAALERGHEVTLFNRGKTRPDLFADLEHLHGQRRRKGVGSREEQDLSALKGRQWDAVVDTSGYFTANVEDMVALLRDSVQHYVFVSSISVYPNLEKDNAPVDETTPVGTLPDRYVTEMTEETYGPLKAYCEQAVEAGFPGRATAIRPGYIVGPEDPYDRLTSRVVRLAKGGDTLAPGDPDSELQMIDVRDLGAFIVETIDGAHFGPFDAVGFDGRISVAEFHHAAKCTLAHNTTFEWVDDAFLVAEGVKPWEELACWTPADHNNHCANTRALAAGLRCRPLVQTIADTHQWAVTQRPDRPWRCGLTADRERQLLAKWRAR